MNKQRSIALAEYISLGFSCTGLLTAAISQQVMYAAIPLMINLPIGLINRQRLNRQIRQVTTQLENITRIEHRLNRIGDQIEGIDTTVIKLSQPSQPLVPIPESLPQDLLDLKQLYRDLDDSHQSLHDRTRNLGELEQQLTTLQFQITQLEQNPFELESKITTLLDLSHQPIAENPQRFYYDLVLDRSGSRQVLIESLQQADNQISIVCPWISGNVISEIMDHLEAALARDIQISIGWGHLSDIKQLAGKSGDQFENLNRDYLLKSNPQYWKYGGVRILEKMQDKYPDQLSLKVVGTHEKFLVCDRQMAMLGSHNFLTSGESSPERELGLKTNDPQIINQLISRFNQPNIGEIYRQLMLN